MTILAYLAAILTGFVLGAVGSGGSILALPILIYLFKIPAIEATSYSLFIVGMTAVYGAFRAQRRNNIRWNVVLAFGLPMLVSVILSRSYILTNIPAEIAGLSRDRIVTILFAIVMLAAARAMWKAKPKEAGHQPIYLLVFKGLLTGLLTGLVGAGGGFIIVPILVLGMGLSMPVAVGTSLAIIAVNSATGFSTDLIQGTVNLNWQLLIIFTAMSAVGLYIGSSVANKLPQAKLKKAFAAMIVLIAVGMILG